MVEQHLQLVAGPGVVHEPRGQLLHLLPKGGVDLPELCLHPAEALELVAELKGCEYWVLAAECDERWAGQGPVRVDPGQAEAERVLRALPDALVAAALDVVRLRDRRAAVKEHLQDLIVVALS